MKRIFTYFKRFVEDQSGTVMVVSAICFPIAVGMVGLGVDASSWMMTKRDLQTAADAAVIAAAWEIANGHDDQAAYAADKEAQANGYNPDMNGHLDLNVLVNGDGQTIVSADIRQEAPVYFAGMFIDDAVYTANSASSAIIEPGGSYCILALDDTADAAFAAVGTVDVDSPNCGIAVNSNSDNAFDLRGFVDVDVDSISIVGDYEIGSNVTLNYNDLRTGSSRIDDPYEDLEVEDHGTCSSGTIRRGNSYNSNATLSPGTYCGGLRISGNTTVTMEPGVYYIDGGDFNVTGGGSITGEGVTIILTNSNTRSGSWGNLDISGGRSITLSAPEEGEETAGIVFFQDRNAPESSRGNSLTGTSEINITGTMYFPTRDMDFGGNNGTASEACTRLIAKTIKLHGTPALGNNCESTGVRDIISEYSVRLIL